MEPLSQELRMKVIRLHFTQKESMTKISRDLKISYTTVRLWIKRYKKDGEKGLIPQYSKVGKLPIISRQVVDRAFQYKKVHPQWGAPFILIKLEDDFPNTRLPKARWLQQLFKRHGLQPDKTQLPNNNLKWAKRVFDRVQVDAKERLKTADGADCCYLNFVDEYSGCELDAFLFPLCPNFTGALLASFRMCFVCNV